MKENEILVAINKMCIESLPPSHIEMWDLVKIELIKNRKLLDKSLIKELP
jgi:hypothetical protein